MPSMKTKAGRNMYYAMLHRKSVERVEDDISDLEVALSIAKYALSKTKFEPFKQSCLKVSKILTEIASKALGDSDEEIVNTQVIDESDD